MYWCFFKIHTLSKLYDVPVGFVPAPRYLRKCIALFAVAEGWLLLDIGLFVFLKNHYYVEYVVVVSMSIISFSHSSENR